MEVDLLGIDLAKRVFQLHGADRRRNALHRSKVLRPALAETIKELHPRVIAMEACSSAHHRRGISDIGARASKRVVTNGCGQGSVFGDLMAEVEKPRAA